jgi:hypothetical protein
MTLLKFCVQTMKHLSCTHIDIDNGNWGMGVQMGVMVDDGSRVDGWGMFFIYFFYSLLLTITLGFIDLLEVWDKLGMLEMMKMAQTTCLASFGPIVSFLFCFCFVFY